MNYGGSITRDIEQLLKLFSKHCTDLETNSELLDAVRDRSKWSKARGIFQRARKKGNVAWNAGNKVGQAQYLFEEICAKTLFNLSGESAPFDPDSPYWLIPNAVAFARLAGIPDTDVLACISLQIV